MKRLFHVLYGEPWWHLVALLASFALCGYAMAQLLAGDWWGVVQWAVGAAVIHDLVAVPLYGSAKTGSCTGRCAPAGPARRAASPS
jgi:hypothetical protein